MNTRHPSLITNDDMDFDINFKLWGAEVDLLSILVKGKKTKISSEDLSHYIQGVFERLIFENVSRENKRELALVSCQREGYTKQQIESYFRGWDQVGNTISDEVVENLTKKMMEKSNGTESASDCPTNNKDPRSI